MQQPSPGNPIVTLKDNFLLQYPQAGLHLDRNKKGNDDQFRRRQQKFLYTLRGFSEGSWAST